MNFLSKKKNKGSLTVEATLVLPLVIVTLLFVSNILNICMVSLCMQQALNNMAKKISQDSYVVYRLAGEKNYAKFIDNLGQINESYDDLEDKVEKSASEFNELQDAAKDVINKAITMTNNFTDKNKSMIEKAETLPNDIDNIIESGDKTIKKWNSFYESIKNAISSGRKNGVNAAIKLLADTGTGAIGTGISYILFDQYRTELKVPANRIENLCFLHSSLNKDGSFTIVLTYNYKNPFSFLNSNSMEYSVINKTIRMTNAITIKPFIGKNGTSFVQFKESKENEESERNNELNVYVISSTVDTNTKQTYKYHIYPDCRHIKDKDIKTISLNEAEESANIVGICLTCKKKNENND